MNIYQMRILNGAEQPGEPCVKCWRTYGITIPSAYLVKGGILDKNELRGFCVTHWMDFAEHLPEDTQLLLVKEFE